MSVVRVGENESIDSALRRFKRKCSSHIEKLPEPKICEFCGRTLYHEGCLFMGKIMTIMNTPQRCNCEQSVAYWKERERIEQERSEREQKEKEHKELLARYKKAGIDTN